MATEYWKGRSVLHRASSQRWLFQNQRRPSFGREEHLYLRGEVLTILSILVLYVLWDVCTLSPLVIGCLCVCMWLNMQLILEWPRLSISGRGLGLLVLCSSLLWHHSLPQIWTVQHRKYFLISGASKGARGLFFFLESGVSTDRPGQVSLLECLEKVDFAKHEVN